MRSQRDWIGDVADVEVGKDSQDALLFFEMNLGFGYFFWCGSDINRGGDAGDRRRGLWGGCVRERGAAGRCRRLTQAVPGAGYRREEDQAHG